MDNSVMSQRILENHQMKKQIFSLWVMPSGYVYQSLSERIASLISTYHGQVFEPHVTVIGEVGGTESDVVARTRNLANVVKPYSVILQAPDFFDEYYKCIFLRVATTPAVMQANACAREIFDHESDTAYQPHLSLFYGTIPVETKKEIVNNLKSVSYGTFLVDSIQLMSTEGDIKSWYLVDRFSLAK
jgi:2'-5' RNA ligase